MKNCDYVKINSVNPLYLIIGEVGGYLEWKNGYRYLTPVSTDKNKEVLMKYATLCDKIKNLVECSSIKASEFEKDFMKTKFNSDDNLLLNKVLKLHNITIVIRSVFQENCKKYPQLF